MLHLAALIASLQTAAPATTSVDVSASFEPFGSSGVGTGDRGPDYLFKHTVAVRRTLGRFITLAVKYDATTAIALQTQTRMPQSVASAEMTLAPPGDVSATISYRTVDGWGGPYLPGTNLGASLRKRFRDGSSLRVEIRPPASNLASLRVTFVKLYSP